MLLRHKYVCPSKSCRRGLEIEIPPNGIDRNTPSPTCTCGSKMKKVYATPVLFKLSKAEVVDHLGEFEEIRQSHKNSF
jgi:hypothetical protein